MDTKRRIMELLLGAKKTALSLSGELGIRESAVRAHLERLSNLGLVSSSFVNLGRGRPKKVYELTEEGLESFPRKYDTMLDLLLQEAERDDKSVIERFTGYVTKELAKESLGGGKGPVSPKEAGVLLDKMGFRTSYSIKEGRPMIHSANCVLRKVAVKHPNIICHGVHTALIEELTGARNVKLDKCMAYGDTVCIHKFPRKAS
ncbi:MAG: ArsR family transcriptional regulator [Thermoprotei archaeon]